MRILTIALLLLMTGCIQYVTHQGNVLKPGLVASIQEGDTRFHVESLLGTPMLKDDLHVNRSIYVESYKNPDTGEEFQRRIEITYNEAERVEHIKRFGFEEEPAVKSPE